MYSIKSPAPLPSPFPVAVAASFSSSSFQSGAGHWARSSAQRHIRDTRDGGGSKHLHSTDYVNDLLLWPATYRPRLE